MKIQLSSALLLFLFLLAGCREDKYNINSLPQSSSSTNANFSDTVYVKQNPDWTGFNNPQAIIVGNEPLVYVADTYNDRIVMLDIAGRVIGYSQPIRRPVALAQDKRLQLLVCAEFDTVLQGQTATFGAVYRLNLPAVNHDITKATPRRVIWDTTLGNYASRRYTAVATYYNNYYIIGRTGQKNTGTFDPDNAILLYSNNDVFLSPVTSTFAQEGTGLLSIHHVTGLAIRPTGTALEYVFSQVEVSSVIPLWKVQWMQFLAMGQTTNWVSKFYPSVDGDIDILRINRFVQPRGLALDPSGNLFVVDAGTDSLYRFNSRGTERYSFGGHNDSYGRNFNQPYGIAFYDNTIFVADKGNNRICRFKLSIDMN
ncbi:MAG: hypothetical protein EHM64_06810 [Ignavibacteriae bacterium]|nr:MAG: hypothetical protein EHM64_06810 [Ignavibacteriota bacterium]